MALPARMPGGRAPMAVSRVFIAAVALFVVAAAVQTARHGVVRFDVALAFAGVIAVGQFAPVRLPGDRPVAPLGTAVAIGYAFLFDVGGRPITQSTAQVVTVAAAGYALGAGLMRLLGRPVRLMFLSRRIAFVAVTTFLFHTVAPRTLSTVPYRVFKQDLRWVALLMVTVVALAALIDMVVATSVRGATGWATYVWMLRDEISATSQLMAAVGASGILIALATPSMKLYALPVFCVPLLLTHFAFRRYAAVRTTYRQTIRSLSRVTEVGGYVTDGHAHRVSLLAVAVGRELGLTEGQIADLEYASLLHDIGQLSLSDPIPGGSTLVVAPVERRRVAELGADIIKTTGVLDRVADIVARQADPYRRHREAPDHSLLLESRIIKAVSAYDDVVGPDGGPEASADALERLRLGMAYEYDPQVVETLTRVVTRFVGWSMEGSRQVPA